MKNNFLLLSAITLTLTLVSPACSKKSQEAAPTVGEGQVSTDTGEKAQAEGTAGTAQAPETQKCTYRIDPNQIKLQWTAYKTTDKTPVKGGFNTTNIEGETTAPSLAALAEGLRMKIDGASFESGDPGRNVTVRDFFFAKLNPPFKMEAIAKNLQGDDSNGNLTIEIDMNGVTKEVPFAYTANEEGEFAAKGGINLMNWKLQSAFDSIHKACEEMHTGKDGISKTWEVVDLEIKGNYFKNCPVARAP